MVCAMSPLKKFLKQKAAISPQKIGLKELQQKGRTLPMADIYENGVKLATFKIN